jgi:acetyltransferase-like isoleucine patch superfamily enzyme
MKILYKTIKKALLLLYALINQINFHFKFRTIDIFLNKIRISLLRMCGSEIGINSSIHPKVMILMPENLVIGNNSNIGSNSEIFNYSKVIIGDNVDIGTQLYVNTNNHITSDPSKPLAYQGSISREIKIGSDIWIGARVTILSNTIIEDRVIIGAGSLINKKLKSGYMYAGVPAKEKKQIN